MTRMDVAKESPAKPSDSGRPESYQPSFDTAIVHGSSLGLSVVSSFIRHLVQVVIVAALAYGSYWVVSRYILQSVEVTGISMMPTLRNSDHYLLDRWTYLIRDPQPNDIVVIRDPEDNLYSVKRIVAAGGDSLWFKDGKVFLNGRELDEPYLPPGTLTFSDKTRSGDEWIVCGKNQYFVMGDNRSHSEDSRAYGPVPRDNIMGTVIR